MQVAVGKDLTRYTRDPASSRVHLRTASNIGYAEGRGQRLEECAAQHHPVRHAS
jgi:hypothetical protein